MKRGHIVKTQLTPEEKLRVAYAYLILGVDQHQLVGMFGVNQGRINDAISDIRNAVDWPKPVVDTEELEEGESDA